MTQLTDASAVDEVSSLAGPQPPPQLEGGLELPQKPPPPPPKSPRPPERIVIFGETGTGKSSLINMIADDHMAGVSSGAQGHTFQNNYHGVTFYDTPYIIWDTAGLNEGECGTVPAQQALMNLKDLILRIQDGVHLLIYCIRASRYRDILRVNYDLFYGIICQSQVPIVAVITGLENESPMENWWTNNSGEFEKYGLRFRGHACVTTIKGKKLKSGEHMYQEEYDHSQVLVRDLIQRYCSSTPLGTNHAQAFLQVDSQITDYYDRFNSRDGTEREALDLNNFLVQEPQDHNHYVIQILHKFIQLLKHPGIQMIPTDNRPSPRRSRSMSSGQVMQQLPRSPGNRQSFTGSESILGLDFNSTPTTRPSSSGPRASTASASHNRGNRGAGARGTYGSKCTRYSPNAQHDWYP